MRAQAVETDFQQPARPSHKRFTSQRFTSMEQELKSKVAIVTGAGRMRSIGRPIAKLLAQAGAAVVITGTGRPPEHYPDDEKAAGWRDIDSVADEIRQAGGRCLALISDVTDPHAVDALIDRNVNEFGSIDILIN